MDYQAFQLILTNEYRLEVTLMSCKEKKAEFIPNGSMTPCWYTLLKERIFLDEDNQLTAKIMILLNNLGLSPNLCGYSYLKRAIEMGYWDPTVLYHVTKMVYPDIAREYHTTVASVERAIRHCIDVIWERGNKELYYCILRGVNMEKPTNSSFIASLTETLRFLDKCRQS